MTEATGQSPREMADAVLGDLSSALGQRLALDANGQCALVFADGVEVVIALSIDANALTLRSEIIKPAPDDADCLRAALAVNYGRLPPGMWMALDRQSGLVVLYAFATLADLTGEDLIALVGGLVDLSQSLRSELMGTATAVHDDDGFDGRGGFAAGFVRG